jgi:hypothetical protein
MVVMMMYNMKMTIWTDRTASMMRTSTHMEKAVLG